MKRLIWFAAFIGALIAGDRAGAYFLQKINAESQFRYSRLYGGNAQADILLLGNSRGLTFYQPHIEAVTGQKTFNFSYNGLPMDLAAALAQDYLDRYPAPRLLLIDITGADRRNNELINGFLPYAAQSERISRLVRDTSPELWYGAQVSRLLRYNNEVFQRALYYRQRSDEDWLLDRQIAPALAQRVGEEKYVLHPGDFLKQSRYIADITKAAQAKGVQVQLLIGPYFPGFAPNVINLDALKQTVESATGLSVRDYRAALSEPALFGDFMHPNKAGAIAYIDLMKKDGVFDVKN